MCPASRHRDSAGTRASASQRDLLGIWRKCNKSKGAGFVMKEMRMTGTMR